MKPQRWLTGLALVVVLTVLCAASRAHAQPPCPHAEIRLDSSQEVDRTAICEAARPWADKGFRTFVYLTDRRTANEEDWFALLDEVETEAGIRGPDGFDKNALAFEASTATDLSWVYSITYGELLYDTPLDTDGTTLFRIQNQMRTAIASGDPSGAFVQALNIAYETNYAVAPAPTEQPLTSRPSEQTSSFPLGGVIAGVLAAGALAAGGYVSTTKFISPAIQRARRRSQLEAHLEVLRTRTSRLMNACDQLLQGETPEETVLYQLFSAYGGEQSDPLRARVHESLRRSQEALDDAFDLRKKLIDPAVQQERSLEQRVEDWEMLHVTLVGNSERILNLTDEELRTLLDPMLLLDRERPDAQLTEQLDALRRELEGDEPIKVELKMVDPAQTDAEGILGYIDQVKAQIGHLHQARRQAPERLAEAQDKRQAAKEETPSPFVMTEKQLYAGIDQRLAQAETALEQELFLRVIELADEVMENLETVQAFVAAVGARTQRQAEIDAITEQGYRPSRLTDDLKEIETDLQTIIQEITAGDYDAVLLWTEELTTDSQRALEGAQEWRALHTQNATGLDHLRDETERIQQYWTQEVAPAWQTLQTYPEGNWKDLGDELDQATQTLSNISAHLVDQISQLNSIEEQELSRVEQMLAQTTADLAQAQSQFQSAVNRLAEVQAAQANIEQALQLTEADIAKAEAYRDREDVKIDPEVDQQIEQAHHRLNEARPLAAAREFIAATQAQTEARRLATTAYATASEQVQEINALQAELETLAKSVTGKAGQYKSQAQALPAVIRTTETNKRIQRAEDSLSQAKQARLSTAGLEDHMLADALRAAIAAFKKASQLADETQRQIKSDRDEYQTSLTATQATLDAAQRAIRKAERAVRNPDARGAGQHALGRARGALPSESINNNTRAALARIAQQAEKAQRYAQQAERQAQQKIQAVKAERRRRRQSASWSVPSVPLARPSSSGSSSQRRSSGSSRRSSSRGSSRRSSSRGSSSRSSSRGSSRRR